MNRSSENIFIDSKYMNEREYVYMNRSSGIHRFKIMNERKRIDSKTKYIQNIFKIMNERKIHIHKT